MVPHALDPITLTVSSHNGPHGSILDSNLLRRDGLPRFYITTDASRTILETSERKRIALINWDRSERPGRLRGPTVIVDALGEMVRTADWLQLSTYQTRPSERFIHKKPLL
ncbi:hypothetical protein MKEN_00250600 [Mycena kentingensis (nom. inval.)]|nr:hypothetical protein MKEN_00250600 [Mycena kentingensis (nom. inval.)]